MSKSSTSSISNRKSDHVRISLEEDVSFQKKTTGFERYDFVHCAMPELDFDSIDISTEFLNKPLSFPLIISAMTGGWEGAEAINAGLAEVCQEFQVGLGVGSQRQAIDDDTFLNSYRIVRKKAPDIVIIGNIGGAQLIERSDFAPIARMIESIGADAIAVHLNPLQELLQPEGDRDFQGILRGIEQLIHKTEVEVIVKEVGCGISEKVARDLVNVGVRTIDIAGAGGTSWAAIESFRSRESHYALKFREWGLPTAESLVQVIRVPQVRVIASGGIYDGILMAKALALGAELCGAALPLLKVFVKEGSSALSDCLEKWRTELTMALLLTGSQDLKALRTNKIYKIHKS